MAKCKQSVIRNVDTVHNTPHIDEFWNGIVIIVRGSIFEHIECVKSDNTSQLLYAYAVDIVTLNNK